MAVIAEDRVQARKDLAWSIAVGGIGIVGFGALLLAGWSFAATLFLIFAGVLFGVFLSAITDLLGRVVGLGHAARLAIVCVVLTGLLAGIMVLGGNTIARQTAELSTTIQTQAGNVRSFLEKHGFDTSAFDLENNGKADGAARERGLPSAGALASGGSAIVSQTLKILFATVGVVGNFFIVLFLGIAFAAQPAVYRRGLVRTMPEKARAETEIIIDKISEMLKRWLLAQLITMTTIFVVTSIGLALIGIPSSFILGVQAGLLAFIPTVGAVLGGLIIVLASLGSGWVAVGSAFALFLAVQTLESYVLTPLLQRQAINIPPATLFAIQILLGTMFGLWGLALALPLMATVKVTVDELRRGPQVAPG